LARPASTSRAARFLGYEHRRATARTRKGARIEFLARFPAPKAMLQVARERVREITARSRLLVPVEQTVQELNLFLRGWPRENRMPGSMRRREESGANGLRAPRRWHLPPALLHCGVLGSIPGLASAFACNSTF